MEGVIGSRALGSGGEKGIKERTLVWICAWKRRFQSNSDKIYLRMSSFPMWKLSVISDARLVQEIRITNLE